MGGTSVRIKKMTRVGTIYILVYGHNMITFWKKKNHPKSPPVNPVLHSHSYSHRVLSRQIPFTHGLSVLQIVGSDCSHRDPVNPIWHWH